MASPGLTTLLRLHLIDSKLHETRARASVLGPAKELLAELASAEEASRKTTGAQRALEAEQTDLELQNRTMVDRVKKLDKRLYGGSVVSPREVEQMQEEMKTLKAQIATHEDRVMEIWEELPVAQALAAADLAVLEEVRSRVEESKRLAKASYLELESRFRKLSAERPSVLARVPPGMAAQYEAIRKRTGNTAMAQIQQGGSCECGMMVPEKACDRVRHDELATCESCHRILYYPVPS